MQVAVVKSVAFFALIPFLIGAAIRICENFGDYSPLNFIGTNCHDSQVVNQNISEIIRSWPGFTAEEYYLTTPDGYKLLIERSYSKIKHKTPILIVHGISMSAFAWVNRGNISLAKLLGDLGYDVWMLNFRGTWYSKGHINLSTNDKTYWNYNLHDLGIYDVRHTIKFVKEKTNRKPIYIGYSMGSTCFFIYSSIYPEESKENVKALIGLAPATNFKDARSIAKHTSYWWPQMKKIIYTLWNGQILPGYSVFLRPLVRFTGGMYIIQYFANLLFGDDYAQMDAPTYPQFATQLLDTVAVEVYSHYLQCYESGLFRNYDYGEEKNLEIYGTSAPPTYDLSKIPVPIAVFASKNDWLATIGDTNGTYIQFDPSVRCGYHLIEYEKWNHIDFLIAKDLYKYLYKHLFHKIRELDKGICNTEL